MNRKVLELIARVEAGGQVRCVGATRRGDLMLEVRRGRDRTRFEFAFYEVPAILHATKVTGQGG